MPFYRKLGNIPHKRHTTFKKEDGSLHYEQLFGTVGFDGMSTLMYHKSSYYGERIPRIQGCNAKDCCRKKL